MSPYIRYHRSVYRRLQRVALVSGRPSAKQMLLAAGVHRWANGRGRDYCIRVAPVMVRSILPRLERFWGLRKEDA